MQCRTKRKEIKAKQDQVIELSDDTEKKLLKLQAEEEAVILKINELQAKLDATSDYRVTRSVTKDMEGQVKRQAAIADEQNELLERQIKIDNLAAQLADMLAKLDHKEHHLTEDFKEKGGEAKARVDALQAQIERLVGELPAVLQSRYAKVKAEKGGRGAAFLEGSHCSACHVELQTGALAKLKAGEAVTECPSCRRIFAARVEED